jgi:hypothetical protein
MASADEQRGRPDWVVYVAFSVLAILAGPIDGYVADAVLVATNAQLFAGMALASLLGGAGLIGYAILRGESLPRAAQWGVLVFLLAPQWCSVVLGSLAGTVPWLHGIGEGTAFLLNLAAPLWLGLVAASDLIQIEVPVACIVSAIAGMGAVLLVIPANSYRLGWVQAPMLLLQILLGIATVVSWAIARLRVERRSIAGTAGCYLLLSGVGNACFALVYERGSWQPLDWHALIAPLLCDAALLAAMWCLWFWLLRRVTLGAFGMRGLAAWAATALPAFVSLGLLQWRVDVAVSIAVAAVAVALRARSADEQPTALGLSGS